MSECALVRRVPVTFGASDPAPAAAPALDPSSSSVRGTSDLLLAMRGGFLRKPPFCPGLHPMSLPDADLSNRAGSLPVSQDIGEDSDAAMLFKNAWMAAGSSLEAQSLNNVCDISQEGI